MVLNLKPMNGFQKDIVLPQKKKNECKRLWYRHESEENVQSFFPMLKGVCDVKEVKNLCWTVRQATVETGLHSSQIQRKSSHPVETFFSFKWERAW